MIPHKLSSMCMPCVPTFMDMSPHFKLSPYPVDRGGKRAQAALTAVNKTLPNTEVFHLNFFLQTTYYSLIQVFNAMYNFQTKAPDFGTLARVFPHHRNVAASGVE